MKSISQITEALAEWPESWAIGETDVSKGQEIIDIFKPFIALLVDSGLSVRTIRRHINNLWLLGGEIIRDINIDKGEKGKKALLLIYGAVGEDGGPYCRHIDSEEEMREFDSTCRKLHKFIEAERQHLTTA